MTLKDSSLRISRIQLGTSRLEYLDPKVLPVFLDKSWIHLGDSEPGSQSSNGGMLSKITEIFKKYSFQYIVTRSFQRVFSAKAPQISDAKKDELYQQTNFETFNYNKGDSLPFDDNSINFIYSEHFFEHLFFDEASSLLQECYRILKPGGVIRTCVPDADLRTYLPPEPVGFPDVKLAHDNPSKHKTRWSVYSFEEVLKFAGYEPVPLNYCDKFGKYVRVNPPDIKNTYDGCADQKLALDMSYIARLDSLIVDGIKKT